MPVSVASLHVHPVKGCRGTDLTSASILRPGVRHDREFMLVDTDGHFLSQRQTPRLALFHADYDGTALTLTGPDGGTLRHPVRPDGPVLPVRVHRAQTVGRDQGDRVARWFSTRLDRPCRLVRFPDDQVRPVDPAYASGQVRFADAFPLLVTSAESLRDLNARLDRPLPMNRFRPNIVLAGWDTPWAEDTVGRLRVGEVELDLVRRCARCVVTTVDQDTGLAGAEPLRTLATFRAQDQRLLFGVNAVPRTLGTVHPGDPVEVLAHGTTPVPL
ncbi:MAG TPA: MOSC N-terminal beta barrel domain-containing protein [Mycobacteriales bacterium]|nr:MOSC N-terminal beta barrel domain-containing protein [Mycobacteriales bacterium]